MPSARPYHLHHGNEEWLFVVAGTPTVRTPVRIVMLSTIPPNDLSICVYPDSEKVGVWPPGRRLRITESIEYWDGEV